MKHIAGLLAVAAALTATNALAADAPTAPVRAFIAAFDKGDVAFPSSPRSGAEQRPDSGY